MILQAIDLVPVGEKRSGHPIKDARRLGMTYTGITEKLGINLWMAKKAARWSNIQNA